MGSRPDLVGQTFGMLTVVRLSDRTKGDGRSKTLMWECRCECGGTAHHTTARLKSRTPSCGCERWKGRHGFAKDGKTIPEYWIWHGMRQRCGNPKHAAYQDYGGRGITVCERWHDFANFIADMGRRPHPDLTLERKNNDLGYCPTNCIWETAAKQLRNRRVTRGTVSGITGVHWDKARSRWLAHIEGRHLGRFRTIEEAIKARKDAEKKFWSADT